MRTRICIKCKKNRTSNPWARQCVYCRDRSNREASKRQQRKEKEKRKCHHLIPLTPEAARIMQERGCPTAN